MNGAAERKERRRNYFINKGLQTRFILKFCLLVIFACATMGGLVYLLSTKTTTTSFEDLRLVVKSTADFILPALALSILIAIALASAACIFVVLFVFHRVVGPLYRLEKTVDEIGSGNLDVEVHLRRTDEVKALAESINNMTKNLKSPLSSCRDRVDELESEIARLKDDLRRRGMADYEIESALKPIQQKAEQIKKNLSYFKISLTALALLCLLFVSSARAYASGTPPPNNMEWIINESHFCTIYFRYDVNIGAVNKKIDTYRVDYGLSAKPTLLGESVEDMVAYKLDLIFLKVREILDMGLKDLRLKVKIYPDQNDLDKIYMEIFGEENKFIAFYVFKLNTLFASEKKISANVLAHEIAHCIVDHYFSVVPPKKVAEMIAQYADLHLRDRP